MTPHRIRVRGRVQGVGFRPFVARLAARHGLSGWVANDGEGVVIEVVGGTEAETGAFVAALRGEAPPRALVDAVEEGPGEQDRATRPRAPGFHIRPSRPADRVTTVGAIDTAPCDRCIAELFDPRDRRYLYPFLACVDCGPRYTITRSLPYDRAATAMDRFRLCPECAREMADPDDRRFHAQALACPACGPRLTHPLSHAVAHLRGGGIVALKGLGGFHLLCDARDAGAVERLRSRKGRGDKPFAVLVPDLATAGGLVSLDRTTAALLVDPRRPVVLAEALPGAGLAAGVAPGLGTLGVMLPSTALQEVLLRALRVGPGMDGESPSDPVLVATSANRSGEPLAYRDDDPALAALADLVLGHDRAILAPCDDSVARGIDGAPLLIRRARGWVPDPIPLPVEAEGLLALGAERRATVALGAGRVAHLSPHLGDVDGPETLARLDTAVSHLTRLTGATARAVAHDRHPDFLTTMRAATSGLPTLAVAHHHAHAAAVLAEHGRLGPAVAVVLDGFGLGPDGGAWGGELLRVDGARCDRLGHLAPLPLPGGDAAAREPWRLAVAVLHALGEERRALDRWGAPARRVLGLLDRAPRTTAAGRWLDAAAALLGVCEHATWDGEAPSRLESLVSRPRTLPLEVSPVLDLLPLFRGLLDRSPAEGADLVHGTLAAALSTWAADGARALGTDTVVLAGGSFVNRPLAEGVSAGLRAAGLTPLLPRLVPPGDGAIALGQLYVAACARLSGPAAR